MKNIILITVFITFSFITESNAADTFIGFLYPAGAKRGSTVEIIAYGQRLNNNMKLFSSNPKIKLLSIKNAPFVPVVFKSQRLWVNKWIKNIYSGNKIPPPKPTKEEELKEWKKNYYLESLDKLSNLELSIAAASIYIKRNALQATPALAKGVIIKLKIDDDAPLGMASIRLYSNMGITNAKSFFIDTADEICEERYAPYFVKKKSNKVAYKTPVILNGQIMPGETDIFKVKLDKNLPYTFSLVGSDLSPFLGDTVPGHFQPFMQLLNSNNREVAFADDKYHNPDPILHFTPKETGIYTLKVSDSLSRGRADFVYRIKITKNSEEYHARKLYSQYKRANKTIPDFSNEEIEITSQTPKIDIIGAISTANVTREFVIKAKKNDNLIFEVFARRHDSPLDSILRLRSPNGEIIAQNDDMPIKLNLDINRQNSDSLLNVKFKESGDYTLELTDVTSKGGRDYKYILQVRQPEETCFVYTNTSTAKFIGKKSLQIKFYVLRKDNFNGPVKISCEGLKAVGNSTIPPNQDSITIPFVAEKAIYKNEITILPFVYQYNNITSKVVAADEVMQAFAYNHLLISYDFLAIGTARKKIKR